MDAVISKRLWPLVSREIGIGGRLAKPRIQSS
jgi:hypothetical protein